MVNPSMSKAGLSNLPTICWQCQSLITQSQSSCELCRNLQAPASLDPFDRLGVTPSLHLDLNALESAYIQATALYHPDRFINCPVQKAHGEAHMAALNQAYGILKDFLSRSIALYERVFGPYTDENIPCATLFLMEIFDLQERAEHLKTSEDKSAFHQEVQILRTQAEQDLAQAFEAGDSPGARRHIQALQYLKKLLTDSKERTHAAPNL